MKYRAIHFRKTSAAIFVWSIFLSDFGLLISGQPIYLFQVLALIYLVYKLACNDGIEKGWLFFFFAAIGSAIANFGIASEGRQFAGDTYPWTSIKGLANIFLFYAVYRASKVAYKLVTPRSLLVLAVFMLSYAMLEFFFSHQPTVERMLSFFHTNPKALHKESLSLLGREHSYGALGFLIMMCALFHIYLRNGYVGWQRPLAIFCLALLFAFAVIAKSKSALISILLFVLLVGFLLIRRPRQSWRNFLVLIFSVLGAVATLGVTFASGFHTDIIESLSGGVGSGSTFIRFNLLQVAILIASDNPIFGVGPGNYKLFFVDYILASGTPIILELETLTDPGLAVGSVDAANFYAGLLAEFGAPTFLIVVIVLLRRLTTLFPKRSTPLSNVELSILMAPVIFGAGLGFYYWSISFFPFYLAILAVDFEKRRVAR